MENYLPLKMTLNTYLIINKMKTNIEDHFYIMRDATICLSSRHRHVAFNGLCYMLHENWNVDS